MLLFTPKQFNTIDFIVNTLILLGVATLVLGNPLVLFLFFVAIGWNSHWGLTYERRADEERIRNSPPKLSELYHEHEQVRPDQDQG